MQGCFGTNEGIIHVEFSECGQTIDSDGYTEALTKLKNRISRVRNDKKDSFILQHDNTRPHTASRQNQSQNLAGLFCFFRPTADLASDFYLLGPDRLPGQLLQDDAVIASVKKCLKCSDDDF